VAGSWIFYQQWTEAKKSLVEGSPSPASSPVLSSPANTRPVVPPVVPPPVVPLPVVPPVVPRPFVPALARYIPGNGQGFVSVRFAEAWKTAGWQKTLREIRKANPASPDLAADMEKAIGLAPADIDRVTVVIHNSEENSVWIVVSSTKDLDRTKLEASILSSSKKTFEGKEYLLSGTDTGAGAALHIVGDRMFIQGTEKGIRQALTTVTRKTSGPLDSGVKLLSRRDHVVGAFNPPPKAMAQLKDQMTGPVAVLKPVADAQSGTVLMNLRTNLDIEVTLQFTDSSPALAATTSVQKGTEAARGLLLLAKGTPETEKPPLKAMLVQVEVALDTLKVVQNGSQVVVRGKVDLPAWVAILGSIPAPAAPPKK
jgi:hypothetical protein